MIDQHDNMTVFTRRTPVFTYAPLGNRRVYTCKSNQWLNKWNHWERDNGATDSQGTPLKCYRSRVDGKTKRLYIDTSMAEINPKYITDRELYSPVDTKYMREHYINGMALKDLVVLEGSQFIRVIEGRHHRDGGKK